VKGVRLITVLDPNAGPVAGDAGRLQQVVWNLLTNAIKFTPRGGRVQVVLERVNSHLELNVTDTGDGIEPDFFLMSSSGFARLTRLPPATTGDWDSASASLNTWSNCMVVRYALQARAKGGEARSS
jgi:signal transduction histidine kinase